MKKCRVIDFQFLWGMIALTRFFVFCRIDSAKLSQYELHVCSLIEILDGSSGVRLHPTFSSGEPYAQTANGLAFSGAQVNRPLGESREDLQFLSAFVIAIGKTRSPRGAIKFLHTTMWHAVFRNLGVDAHVLGKK